RGPAVAEGSGSGIRRRCDTRPATTGGRGRWTNDPACPARGVKRTNHRVTEDTETRHTEKTGGVLKTEDVCCLQHSFCLSLCCLRSVSSVTLWFVLFASLPLDRGRRLAADVVDDA